MNSSAIRLFFALALTAGLIVGCGGDDDDDGGETTEPVALTPAEIQEMVGPAVVNITGRLGEEKAGGTGILYSTDEGVRVLTNDHVVAGTTALKVEVAEQSYTARILGEAPCQDVAVLELPSAGTTELTTATFGESTGLESGEEVTALGYPTSGGGSKALATTPGTVTTPQIEGKQISPDLPFYQSLILHTATLNPGNSGGPLLNSAGEVVGVNTLSGGDTSENQFYAISIDQIKPLLESLEAGNDQVNLGWNIAAGDGPTVVEVFGEDFASVYGGGVIVLGVENGLPADEAKDFPIEPLDRILEINGSRVQNVPQVCKILESASPGDKLEITEEFLDFDTFKLVESVPLEITIPATQEPMTTTTPATTTEETTTTP